MKTKRKPGRPVGSKATPWIRVEAAIASDAKMVRAGMLGGLVFRALLEMSKLHGWRGVIPKGDIDGLILWRYLNAGPGEATPEQLEAAFQRVIDVGLVTPLKGDGYVICSWAKHQKDATDEKDQKPKGTIPNHSKSLGTPDVTGRDVTGLDVQDETEKTQDPPVVPPSEDGVFSSTAAPSSGALHQELRMRNLNGRGGCGTRFWLDAAEHCVKAGATAKALLGALDTGHPNAGPREVWSEWYAPPVSRGRGALPETNGTDAELRAKYAKIEGRA